MSHSTKYRLQSAILLVASLLVMALISPRAQEGPVGQGGRGRGNIREFLGLGPPPDPVAAERGEKLYVPNCAFCHGAKARGAEGPNLIRSTMVLHDERGELIGPFLIKGRADKGMPAFPNLTESQAYDIAQFLHMQVELAANRGTYKHSNIVTGDAQKGEAYFNSKCKSCHSPTGDLAKIGSKYPPDQIQTRLLWPGGGGFGAPTYPRKATVTLSNGRTVTGTIKRLDDFNISLYDADGNYHSWPRDNGKVKVEVEDRLAAHRQLLEKYTDEEMHNLTAYLVTLK